MERWHINPEIDKQIVKSQGCIVIQELRHRPGKSRFKTLPSYEDSLVILGQALNLTYLSCCYDKGVTELLEPYKM